MKNTNLCQVDRKPATNNMALQIAFQQKAHQEAKRLASLLYLRHQQTGCQRQVPYPEAYHDALDCLQASGRALAFLACDYQLGTTDNAQCTMHNAQRTMKNTHLYDSGHG